VKGHRTIAILEVMWGDPPKTSMANPNYLAQAPRCFRINPQNHSGRRLYTLLGHRNLLVTNACPQLVDSSRGCGNPDAEWLKESLLELWPFDLLLVCGSVAQDTYGQIDLGYSCRTLYIPHPAARQWSRRDQSFAAAIIQEGKADLHLRFRNGRLRAQILTQ